MIMRKIPVLECWIILRGRFMLTNKTTQIHRLCKCHINEDSPNKTRWYPYSMPTYEDFLSNYIDNSHKKLRKNIAYNIQYL